MIHYLPLNWIWSAPTSADNKEGKLSQVLNYTDINVHIYSGDTIFCAFGKTYVSCLWENIFSHLFCEIGVNNMDHKNYFLKF